MIAADTVTVESAWALYTSRAIATVIIAVCAYYGAYNAVIIAMKVVKEMLERMALAEKKHAEDAAAAVAASKEIEAAKAEWMRNLQSAVSALQLVPESIGSLRMDISNLSLAVNQLKDLTTLSSPSVVAALRAATPGSVPSAPGTTALPVIASLVPPLRRTHRKVAKTRKK